MTCVCISVLTLKDKRPWSVFYAELIKHPSVTELLNEAFSVILLCHRVEKPPALTDNFHMERGEGQPMRLYDSPIWSSDERISSL